MRDRIVFILLMTTLQSYFAKGQDYIEKKEAIFVVEEDLNYPMVVLLDWVSTQGINVAYRTNDIHLSDSLFLTTGRYSCDSLIGSIVIKKKLRVVKRKHKVLLVPQKGHRTEEKTISGFVRDVVSKETLIGAAIYIPDIKQGVYTNKHGFFSVKVPKNTTNLVASFLGYSPVIIDLDEEVYDIELKPKQESLVEVKVRPNRSHSTSFDHEVIRESDLGHSATFLGETDLVQALQFRAGVSGGVGAGGGFSVRGGNPNHNLFLIDGVQVYNPSHLANIFSVFNSAVVKQVDFYQGSFPSRYNGRLSSVVDIRTKEGDMRNYHGSVSLSPLTFTTHLEGPILKDKASFIGSLRRSFLDLFFTDLTLNLFDLNLKANYVISKNDRVFLSFYKGHDRFNLKLSNNNFFDIFSGVELDWGNTLLTAKWNHIQSANLFQETNISFSSYNNSFNGNTQSMESVDRNKILDFVIQTQWQHTLSNRMLNTYGVNIRYQNFVFPFVESRVGAVSTNRRLSMMAATLNLYYEGKWRISDMWHLKAGINGNFHMTKNATFAYASPRATIGFLPTSNINLYASYSRMDQFQHEITIGYFSLPTELRAPSSKSVPPEISNQVEIGAILVPTPNSKLKVQAYLKRMDNILRYKDGQNVAQNLLAPSLKDRVHIGTRRVKGANVSYEYRIKLLTCGLSYSLIRSEDAYPEINGGAYYPSLNDIRHNLNGTIDIRLTKKLRTFITGYYSTGRPVTLPEYAIQSMDHIHGIEDWDSGSFVNYNSYGINNHRLSDNYSLNVGASYKKSTKRQHTIVYRFGVNNIVGRPSPIVILPEYDSSNRIVEFEQMSYMNAFPYISFSYAF
ncbi:TonB-dependent receptor [Halosquirtibacter xylanolyticus]|uniref:TonB-dependent receptor n=1 Tax=Halosquirtibacter xylanolyticus TaxID=3374599 RepID=UPI0037479796|nr:TonB-dependent receptor [Prolixibacteraceae bacterium]